MLDEWVEIVKQGKILPEKDFRQLCEKVGQYICIYICRSKKFYWRKRTYSL